MSSHELFQKKPSVFPAVTLTGTNGTMSPLFQNGFSSCFVFSITSSISFSNATRAKNRKFHRKNWKRCRKKTQTGTAGADSRPVIRVIMILIKTHRQAMPVCFCCLMCLFYKASWTGIYPTPTFRQTSVHGPCPESVIGIACGPPCNPHKPSSGLFSPLFSCKKDSLLWDGGLEFTLFQSRYGHCPDLDMDSFHRAGHTIRTALNLNI